MVGVWGALGLPSLSYGFYFSFLVGLFCLFLVGEGLGWGRINIDWE